MPPRPSSSSNSSRSSKKPKVDVPAEATHPDREDKNFNHEKADIILRAPPHTSSASRAHVLFPLRSLVLRGASPVFDDLLDIPQPPGSPPMPIINLTEDADTVRRFLLAIDPSTSGSIPSLPLQDTKDLFVLAVKYQIDWLASETEKGLFSYAKRANDLELFEFAVEQELFGVVGRVLMSLVRPTLAMFPKALRRKMGDDLWDGIVDCYAGERFTSLAPMLKGLGFSADQKFEPKRKVFDEAILGDLFDDE